MLKRDRSSEKGVALVVAVAASLMVLFIVMAVMNLSFNSFNAAFLQADHAAAQAACEAGVRYVFNRIELDTTYTDAVFNLEALATRPPAGFANAIRHAQTHAGSHGSPRAYVITSRVSGNVCAAAGGGAPDFRTNDIFMGALLPSRVGREVDVTAQSGINGVGQPEFRVRVFSDYGD